LSPEARALSLLAASVADGAAVDWNQAEAGVAAGDRKLVRHLRLVENISSLYRSIPDLDATIGDEIPDGPRWGRLVMQERIGEGTSCEVIQAFDTDLYRPVALKLLHADGVGHRDAHDRILQEARRLARVHHPHVVQVLGAEKHNGRVGLWMELIDGQPLDQILRERGPFSAREAAAIGQDLLSALAAVHAAHVLHRDIKAQNVMREAGGRIVLMDFGTGEELRRDRGTTRIVGTPLYLAPEILDGRAASVQSDLYSVGVLLFYLVTGTFPVAATTMEQLATTHRAGKVRRLRDARPDLPRPFVAAVDRALEAEPGARFQTAGEMEAALNEPASFRAAPAVAQAAPTTWRPAFLATAAATLAVIVGLIAWTTPWRSAPAPVSGVTTLAVLPFRDVSATPLPDRAEGFTEELIGSLGRIGALRVMTLTSVKPYASVNRAGVGGGETSPLGADLVLEGTIARPPQTGNSARVSATLRRADRGATLWSGSFDWVPGSSESVQAAITSSVASALRVNAPGPTRASQGNPVAEQWELRGRKALTDYGTEASRRAVESFRQAVEADKTFARAFGGLSRAYVRLGQFGDISMNEARQQAVIAMRRAIELDPNQADARLASADLSFYYDWDWATAEAEYLRALELNPSLTRARMNLADLFAAKRDFNSAFVQADQARQLDTTSEAANTYAVLLLYADRLDDADKLLDETLARESNSPATYLLKGRVAEGRGQYKRAHELMQKAASLSNGGGVPLQVAMVALRVKAGETAAANTEWAGLEEQSRAGTIRLTNRDRAYLKLAQGDLDGACEYFERALDERDWSLIWLTVDPRVDALRGKPRFEAILKHIGLV
jgi:TolB-like protein/tetratricopeptide (TPR) repeat protein